MTVDMTDQEWAQVMFVLANAEGKGITWGMVNPLLMKLGGQLKGKQEVPPKSEYNPKRKNAGEEVRQ